MQSGFNKTIFLSAVVRSQNVVLCVHGFRVSNLGVQGLGGELVPPLTLLVVQQHHSVHCAHGELGVVRRPGHASDLGSAILEKKIHPIVKRKNEGRRGGDEGEVV